MNQENELMWQGRNLILAALLGLIVLAGTFFELLQSFKTPGRALEILMRGRPPIVPLHEWTIEASDGKVP
jgi:hypothetical protein